MAVTYTPPSTSPVTTLLTSRFYILASGEETSPRTNLTHLNGAAVSGTLYLSYFTAQKTETITQVTTTTGSTSAGATQTLSRIGVYSEAANGDLTLVASTANDTALWRTTYTDYTKSFSSSWTKQAGQVYAVATLIVTAAALPTWLGLNAPSVGILGQKLSTRPRICGTFVSQTDLPSTVANGNIGQSTQPVYALILP